MTSKKILFLDVYYEYLLYAKQNLKEQTFVSKKYKFNSHILPYFKDMYLEDITSKTIIEWKDYILEKNFSNNQNNSLYYTLSGFFDYCSKFFNFDKSIVSNAGCFREKYEEKKVNIYTIKQFKCFIKYVDNEIYKQFFNFMFYTGTRPGEAFALQFKDLYDGYVNICKTMDSHGKREIGTPKTKSSYRKIKIDNRLFNDLLYLKKIYEKEVPFNDNLFVFGGVKPLSPTSVNRVKLKACEKAKLQPLTLHQFRHSHATMLQDKHIVINEISRRLGHSKTSTTLDIYTHTYLTQEKRVQRTLNFARFSLVHVLKYKIKSILK